MGHELSGEVQQILSELPSAIQDVDASTAALRDNSAALRALPGLRAALSAERDTALTSLAEGYVELKIEGYGPHAKSLIGLILGKGGEMPESPPLEECDRIAELDRQVAESAGQPIVILRPGRTWFDVGILEEPRDTSPGGLGAKRRHTGGKIDIELPTAGYLAIDTQTGQDAKDRDDEELNRRIYKRDDELVRPSIDPINTRLESAPVVHLEDPRLEPETTVIGVGYTNVIRVMNEALSFDPDTDTDPDPYFKFEAITKLRNRLEEMGIAFDPDFIDGYLDYRIAQLEKDIQEREAQGKEADSYSHMLVKALLQKRHELQEGLWLKRS